MAVMIAHARDPVLPPSRVHAGIPQDLEDVIVRCLAKDAAGRFADAESLERTLSECACAADWDQKTHRPLVARLRPRCAAAQRLADAIIDR